MNNRGFSLSLVFFLISLIIAGIIYLAHSSYGHECPCLKSGHCCVKITSADFPETVEILCETVCYCPFHENNEELCVEEEKTYKRVSKLLMKILGACVLVGLLSAALFYFEPWYDFTCCNEEDIDDDAILGNSVIPKYLTVQVLEERASADIKK